MASKAAREAVILWDSCRGRNGFDIPAKVPDDQCCEALNIYFLRDGLGTRRNGSSYPTINGATPSFSGVNAFGYLQIVSPTSIASGVTYVVTRDGTPKLIGFDSAWLGTALTVSDAISNPTDVNFVAANNKLFMAYNSPVNRLHVVNSGGTALRLVGLKAPASAPTAADGGGAGTYPATPRWYRVRWQTRSGSNLLYQSNPSAALPFVPDGAHVNVTVTRPTAAGESETHWQVEGSATSEDGPFYDIGSPVAIGTTTYADTQDPATYDDGEASPESGSNTPWPSVKYLLWTGTRLIGFGVWETTAGDAMTPLMGRVYYSPPIGTTDGQDEESVQNTVDLQGFVDISRPSGQEDRALCGPLNNAVFVFQSKGVWQLFPTGEPIEPFRRVQLDDSLGAFNQQSTFLGQDENGQPCVYFIDPQRGPYRYGPDGFQWLGYDVQDIWATFNPAATGKAIQGVFYKEKGHAFWWIATGSNNDPDKILVFNAKVGRPSGQNEVRGGWSIFTGNVATARASIVRVNTGSPLGGVSGTNTTSIYTVDDAAANVDFASGLFNRDQLSKGWIINPPMYTRRVDECYGQAKVTTGQTLTASYISNYDSPNKTQSAKSLTASGGESRMLIQFDGITFCDAFVTQIQLQDASSQLPTEVDWVALASEQAQRKA